MPRGARSPFDPKIPKRRQKDLARQLRASLAEAPLDMQRMTEVLGVEPEAVVVVLRRLRGRKRRGRLRSTIRYGHVAWWWESFEEPAAEAERPRKKVARKHRDEHA